MSRKYFGTDGIRGKVGQFPITADFVMKLGWAIGKVLAHQGHEQRLVIVGKDTRVSGYMFESALESGLIASGVDVGLLGPMPTPAIAYLTRTFNAQAGIVISASHNAHHDNGIKFFSADGFKLDDDIEAEIESYLDKEITTELSDNLGKAFRITDAAGRYIEYCKNTLSRESRLSGMNIVLDCAHGATYHIAPKVFAELGANIILIGAEPNGRNINHQCGATDTLALQQKVLECSADFGIAFDGDGDRVQFVDSKGVRVDGDQLLYAIACYFKGSALLRGVVGTLMSNFALEEAFKNMGVEFVRANVGDRYVIEQMKDRGFNLGGESSGHIICSNFGSTGDGIVAALQMIAAMLAKDTDIQGLLSGLRLAPQIMINVPIAKQIKKVDNPLVLQAVQEAEALLKNAGRVLLRPSGTEPLIRVMVEGSNQKQIEELAEQIAAEVKSHYSV